MSSCCLYKKPDPTYHWLNSGIHEQKDDEPKFLF